ncbi:hypothetical protein OAA38_00315 [bacterium]|nr:hypothetical protein [bacterium]
MIYDQDTLAEQLGKNVDWEAFFTMVNDLGSQLNERQLRFLKARLIESAIARMSNGKIEWVDEIGQDHQFGDVRIETKFCTNSLTTSKGGAKKGHSTSEIKLTNTMGSSDGRSLPNTFDYLLIVDADACAIVSRDALLPHVTSAGDGLKAKVPFNELTFITKIDKNALTSTSNISIMSQVDALLFQIADDYILQNNP